MRLQAIHDALKAINGFEPTPRFLAGASDDQLSNMFLKMNEVESTARCKQSPTLATMQELRSALRHALGHNAAWADPANQRPELSVAAQSEAPCDELMV